ncbi:hypothetical protein RB595_008614 [Gaeumannomyces hyphopodioides]
MAVQAQWSLDTTAGSAFNLLSGVIQAATTDNVQAIALLACERFGSTLAMSDETMSKIETSVVPTPPSIPLRFLQAKIGFSKHDCAAQLGKSKAGVRFLGLAAALITTMEPIEAAKALDLMLSKSAADPTQLPTLRQLRDLLLALEPRCLTAGFADSVHGWEPLVALDRSQRARGFQSRHPSPDCLALVVDSFRQIGRIGDAKITGATIKTTFCGPWLVAFTKWCLGAPPSVYFQDGTSIIEQPRSLVRIYIMNETPRDVAQWFTVQTHYGLGNLSELVLPDTGHPCLGMVSIDVFGRRLLDMADKGNEARRQALAAAVPHTICQVISNADTVDIASYAGMVFCTDTGPDPQLAKQLGISNYPERRAVERAMNLVLGLNSATKLEDLEEGLTMRDIPVVRSLLNEMGCRCALCKPSPKPTSARCGAESFFEALGFIVSVVLGVSFFRWPEGLKFNIDSLENIHELVLRRASLQCQYGKGRSGWHPYNTLDYALKLVGHPGPGPHSEYVASAMRGQVVYPTIFETLQIRKHGFLNLDHHRGKLMYKDDEYSSVVGGGESIRGHEYFTSASPSLGRPVDRPCNLFLGYRVSWEVVVAESTLMVHMSVTNAGKNVGSVSPGRRRNPLDLLMRAGDIFMVENCGHDPSSPLSHPSPHQWLYAGPTLPEDGARKDSGGWVVAVDGASDLCIFTLASPYESEREHFIIRERACLSCCVEAAEKLNVKVIIL